jgi:hypothetical protein
MRKAPPIRMAPSYVLGPSMVRASRSLKRRQASCAGSIPVGFTTYNAVSPASKEYIPNVKYQFQD